MSNVYGLSEGFKVIGSDGRISGTWVVLLPSRPNGHTWIKPHEVTFYDESRRSGIVFYSADLSCSVREGVAEISRVAERKQYDVEDVENELRALLVEIARVANLDSDA
ncbi:hypothetical protein [Microbacterium aurugineum]|uniref:hypothetical protein n=1 Tax=Microbacterium aurugineum TaxID=2851642 RepID=UPI0020BF6012|nr:hypothetical protein [Microbacterium aurugineum]MCK8477200.1 hypothetical protein [Microbacterium aurugineum]